MQPLQIPDITCRPEWYLETHHSLASREGAGCNVEDKITTSGTRDGRS
jgi:hypothetical protein